jgi:biopolymer transport protein ExbD
MAGKLSSGGKARGGSMAPNSEPNVIPFIDIMLVLLIIFMVAAPIPTVDIRVDLPSGQSRLIAEPGRAPTRVALEEEAGQLQYWVDGVQVPSSGFEEAVLEQVRINNPALQPIDYLDQGVIVFRADQETAYANVVGTMTRLQGFGFNKVSLLSELAQPN